MRFCSAIFRTAWTFNRGMANSGGGGGGGSCARPTDRVSEGSFFNHGGLPGWAVSWLLCLPACLPVSCFFSRSGLVNIIFVARLLSLFLSLSLSRQNDHSSRRRCFRTPGLFVLLRDTRARETSAARRAALKNKTKWFVRPNSTPEGWERARPHWSCSLETADAGRHVSYHLHLTTLHSAYMSFVLILFREIRLIRTDINLF